jgi:hypothetical protein
LDFPRLLPGPLKRRGPARKRRYAPRHEAKPEAPGEKLVALAESLRLNTDGGALLRRLHPDRATG